VAAPLPRVVKALGLVSLLTDASSEMIYPLLPAFVIGALRGSPAFLGVVEGLAETTAALVKLAAGRLADRLPRRKPLVVAGYALSSLVRPLVALATVPGHVLGIRLLDRAGKGVRGAPRDALLADVTPEDQRGRAYGFHRAMDHAGAVLGPLLASTVLLVTADLRIVFALAAVPAALAVAALVFGVREETHRRQARVDQGGGGRAGPGLRPYLCVLAVFTLGNSSDAFLLLRAQEGGIALPVIPLLWSFHHLVKSVASTTGGSLSDRVGRKKAIVAGWSVYALAYVGFAQARTAAQVFALFALYGLFHALTEGPERALVADLAGPGARGSAFGLYHAVTGAVLLPASLLTGFLWQRFSPAAALGTGAALAAAAAIALLLVVPETRHTR
jgi:MFS family permease